VAVAVEGVDMAGLSLLGCESRRRDATSLLRRRADQARR
jgi:hypothetical protein